MKVLVTGGAGYIGSHTAVELLDQGFQVIIVDNLSNSTMEVIDGIESICGHRPEFEKLDLCDQASLNSLLKKHNDLDAVIHFAAFKSVSESVQFPEKYYYNNLVSLLNLLDFPAGTKIPPLVFSSSCTVYGQATDLPVREDSPILPAASPYGNTKQISEEIIRDSVLANESFKAISLRYFNPIGAHPSALIGELPIGIPDNLVPYITQTGMELHPHLRVFGNDYNTPDGSAIRDYIHVTDLARAHVAAVDRLLSGKQKQNYEVFNLGTGRGTSVFEVIRSFEKISGRSLPIIIEDRREGDIEKIWADSSLANKELGWETKSSLDDAIRSAWEWEKNYRSSHPGNKS